MGDVNFPVFGQLGDFIQPLVVLSSGEVPGTEQLVLQLSHTFMSNGLGSSVDSMPCRTKMKSREGEASSCTHYLASFMSLKWRYSLVMALDCFSSSSSGSRAFGGLPGGRVASHLTASTKRLILQEAGCFMQPLRLGGPLSTPLLHFLAEALLGDRCL